jgi:hypothetical protein
MFYAVLAVAALLLMVSRYESADEHRQTSMGSSAAQARVADVAAAIAEGVGTIKSSFAEGSTGPVYVFEEFHTSRVGQLEIAVMLVRLREQFAVKRVGLEGAIRSPRALDATWFHHAGGDGGPAEREDVAVRMLAEGEISSAEFLALLFPDEEVYGTEVADLYNRDSDIEGDATTGYLVSIAEKNAQQNLSQPDIQNLNRLIQQGKRREAIELLIDSDPWTREQYAAVKKINADNAGATSCEAMEQRVRGLQTRADEMGVSIDAKIRKTADDTIDFYQTCQRRSLAMVNRMAELTAAPPGTSAAMIIGAAHTEGVMRLLRERNVSFVVIAPRGLNPKAGSLTNEQFRRKTEGMWARTSPGTLGLLLNAPAAATGQQGDRKPPPIIETATARSYASAQLAGMLIAMAARDRKRVPEDIWDRIKDLPEFTADRESFVIAGYDVIYKTTLKQTDGKDRIVWARVGSADTPAFTRTLQQKLLQARADLGGDSNLPPTKPPINTTAARDEGPGDGKRGNVVISRTGLRSLAVYGSSKADVLDVGRLSG